MSRGAYARVLATGEGISDGGVIAFETGDAVGSGCTTSLTSTALDVSNAVFVSLAVLVSLHCPRSAPKRCSAGGRRTHEGERCEDECGAHG